MHLRSLLLPIASLIAVTLAYSRPVPAGWTVHRRADPDTNVLVRVSLVQPNLHNLDTYLLDVADPQSANYGQHWTPSQVKDTFRPSQGSVDAVRSWLAGDFAVEPVRVTQKDEVLTLNITVAQAERIFATKYNVYLGSGDSERVACHEGHNFPAHIGEHVDFVWPELMYGGPRLSRRSNPSATPGAHRPRIVQSGALNVSMKRVSRGLR